MIACQHDTDPFLMIRLLKLLLVGRLSVEPVGVDLVLRMSVNLYILIVNTLSWQR
jgi:hypothetical protein